MAGGCGFFARALQNRIHQKVRVFDSDSQSIDFCKQEEIDATVYTVRIANDVFVLHCFQKKSTQGITTPKHEIELIKSRLKTVEASLGIHHDRN